MAPPEDEEEFPPPPDDIEDDDMMVGQQQQQQQHPATTLHAGTMPSHYHHQQQHHHHYHHEEAEQQQQQGGAATVEEWRKRCEEGKKRMETLLDNYHVRVCGEGASSGRRGGRRGQEGSEGRREGGREGRREARQECEQTESHSHNTLSPLSMYPHTRTQTSLSERQATFYQEVEAVHQSREVDIVPHNMQSYFSSYWQDERGKRPPTVGQSKAIKLHLQHLSEALEETGWTTAEEVRGYISPFPLTFCLFISLTPLESTSALPFASSLPPFFLPSAHRHTIFPLQKIFKQMVLDEKAAIRARLKLKGKDVPLSGRMTEAQRVEDARVEALIDWRKVRREGGREGGRKGKEGKRGCFKKAHSAFPNLLSPPPHSSSLTLPPSLPPSLPSLDLRQPTSTSPQAPPLGPSPTETKNAFTLPPSLPPLLRSPTTYVNITPSACAPPLDLSLSYSPTGKTSWPLPLRSRPRRKRGWEGWCNSRRSMSGRWWLGRWGRGIRLFSA